LKQQKDQSNPLKAAENESDIRETSRIQPNEEDLSMRPSLVD
jgi:hypothetical protein